MHERHIFNVVYNLSDTIAFLHNPRSKRGLYMHKKGQTIMPGLIFCPINLQLRMGNGNQLAIRKPL